MKYTGTIILILFFSMAGAQTIPIYDSFQEFEKEHLKKQTDTTYVINFWATYCAPCIKEMPAFRKLEKNYVNKPVEIILTSLDFGSNVKDRVRTFMEQHNIQSKVVILDDPDGNSWINKISEEWSGALPGTLIYNRKFRKFHKNTITYTELQNIVQSKMIQP